MLSSSTVWSGEPGFYRLLHGIDATLTAETRSRWYLDTAGGKERWDVIVDVDQKAFYLCGSFNRQLSRCVRRNRHATASGTVRCWSFSSERVACG